MRVGIFTLIFALGSAFGPLIGGVLVARWGWPAVFWFRAPIALTSLVCAARAAGRRQDSRPRPVRYRWARFCWRSA